MRTSLWGTYNCISNENNYAIDKENERTEAGETSEKRKLSWKSFPSPLSAPRGFMVTDTVLLRQIIQPHKDVVSHYM